MKTIFQWFAILFFTILPQYLQAQIAIAGQKPQWVNPVEYSTNTKHDVEDNGGFYYFLIDYQQNIAAEETYRRFVYQLVNSEGVQQMSDITIDYDPLYQKLTFHEIYIHRGNEKINQLFPQQIRTIQRETSMDRHLYDGMLTKIVNLKDVRAGDIIEYAFTISGFNPVFDGHYSNVLYFEYSLPYGKSYQRIIVPQHKNLSFNYKNGEIKPLEKFTALGKEYIWTNENVDELISDYNIPPWYDPFKHVWITDFDSWEQMGNWATKHFHVNQQEKNKLSRLIDGLFEHTQTELLISEIVQFVQDDIRYLGFEHGLNSHKPHTPAEVLRRRFGDCKDKSLLLSTILNLKGIEAYPVLVNTDYRKHTNQLNPAINVFNHCVVKINHNQRSYFVDPTISNQGGNIYERYFPNFKKGFVIKPGEKKLTELPSHGLADITEENIFDILEIGGGGNFSVITTYKGIEADIIRGQFASTGRSSLQKSYLEFYGFMYPGIELLQPMQIEDDRDKNIFVVREFYTIPEIWESDSEDGIQIYCEFSPMTLSNYVNITEFTGRKTPFSLEYPLTYNHYTYIRLPEEWNVSTDTENLKTDFYEYNHFVLYDNQNYEITFFHQYKTLSEYIPAKHFRKFIQDHQFIYENLHFQITYNNIYAQMEGGTSNIPFLLIVFSTIAGLILVYKLYGYDPVPKNESNEAESIGGWLYLVAFGLVITPFSIIYQLYSTPEFFDNQLWHSLIKMEEWSLIFIVTFELVFNVVFLIFGLLILVLFFQRRSSLPLLISFFYGVNMVVMIFDHTYVHYFIDATGINEHVNDLVRSILVAAIWIPYFNLSKRVKRTFIKRNKAEELQTSVITEA